MTTDTAQGSVARCIAGPQGWRRGRTTPAETWRHAGMRFRIRHSTKHDRDTVGDGVVREVRDRLRMDICIYVWI
jgi:hypothetical protein